jgi:hypothetical protein
MDEALPKLFECGPRSHVLEDHQNLDRMHLIALANVDLTYDPPFKVLDGLAATVRTNHAGGNRCTGERGDRRPGTEPAEEKQYRRVTHELGSADHVCQWQRAGLPLVPAATPPQA